MIKGFARAFVLSVAGLMMSILGLVVVLVALPFRTAPVTPAQFTNYPSLGSWALVRLPKWALWWDNCFDGMWGDKRGWWANRCGGKHDSIKNMWLWAAVRNPSNYFSRVVCGVDVSCCVITKVAGRNHVSEAPGQREWQILKAVRADGVVFPRLFASIAITRDHAFMIDIGWKVKLSHNGMSVRTAAPSDRCKGCVFTISPWKALI